MKAIYGNLDVNKKYEIVDTLKSDDYCGCDNCNKPIKNIAVLKDGNDAIYNVGLDCASALTEYGGISFMALTQAKKEISRLTKLYCYIKKTMDMVKVVSHNGEVFYDLFAKNANFRDYQLTETIFKKLPTELQNFIKEKIVA
jgi:hypothetical protein